MQTERQYWVVTGLGASFLIPVHDRVKKVVRRFPFISLLASLSLSAVLHLLLFDVDAMGNRVYLRVILLGAGLSVMFDLAVGSHFALRYVLAAEESRSGDRLVSWLRGERLVIAIAFLAVAHLNLLR